MVWLNNSQDSMGTPSDAHTGIVQAPHGNLQCFSYPTGPVLGPCVTRKGVVRRPNGHMRELTQPVLAKIPYLAVWCSYRPRAGPARAVHGLFTISKHPDIPTILPANQRTFENLLFFFKHWKEIVKSVAFSGWTDNDHLQIWSSHSLILHVQIITYTLSISL